MGYLYGYAEADSSHLGCGPGCGCGARGARGVAGWGFGEEPPPPIMATVRAPDGRIAGFSNIFARSADLPPGSAEIITTLARSALVKANLGRRVEVRILGFSDASGQPRDHLDYSRRRAEAVKAALHARIASLAQVVIQNDRDRAAALARIRLVAVGAGVAKGAGWDDPSARRVDVWVQPPPMVS